MGGHGRTDETEAKAVSGWIALLFVCALLGFGVSFAISGIGQLSPIPIGSGFALLAIGMFCTRGFLTLQPDQAALLVFLGSYAGTCRHSGPRSFLRRAAGWWRVR